jgi:hypothetical protein
VDFCDHFETPADAYKHIEPLLTWMAQVRNLLRVHTVQWFPSRTPYPRAIRFQDYPAPYHHPHGACRSSPPRGSMLCASTTRTIAMGPSSAGWGALGSRLS